MRAALGLALLWVGCAASHRVQPLPEAHRRTVTLVAATWRAEGLPFPGPCERAAAGVTVDHDLGRCRAGDRACTVFDRVPRVHLEPGAAETSLLVHELWHAWHRCSGVAVDGDPQHRSGHWRTPGADPVVDDRPEAKALRRVRGQPEPAAEDAP